MRRWSALGHEPEHLALARCQLGQGLVPLASAQELGDHLGVHDGAAAGDPPDRVDELVDVEDPVSVPSTSTGSGRASANARTAPVRPRSASMQVALDPAQLQRLGVHAVCPRLGEVVHPLLIATALRVPGWM